jgi:hypothetical protein
MRRFSHRGVAARSRRTCRGHARGEMDRGGWRGEGWARRGWMCAAPGSRIFAGANSGMTLGTSPSASRCSKRLPPHPRNKSEGRPRPSRRAESTPSA